MKRFRVMEEKWSDGSSKFFVEKCETASVYGKEVEEWKRKSKKFNSPKKANKLCKSLEALPFVAETVEWIEPVKVKKEKKTKKEKKSKKEVAQTVENQ